MASQHDGENLDGVAELPPAVPGVNKVYLRQYIMIFQRSYSLKAVSDEFSRILLESRGTTKSVT